MPLKLPKAIQFPPNKQQQQSAAVYLYRHQQGNIVPSTSPPWQCCAIVSRCCQYPDPKTRKWHKQCR
eukprot:14945855-Ditylum_brightwellii.AAC.1